MPLRRVTARRAKAERPAILATSVPVSSTAAHDVTVSPRLQPTFCPQKLNQVKSIMISAGLAGPGISTARALFPEPLTWAQSANRVSGYGNRTVSEFSPGARRTAIRGQWAGFRCAASCFWSASRSHPHRQFARYHVARAGGPGRGGSDSLRGHPQEPHASRPLRDFNAHHPLS